MQFTLPDNMESKNQSSSATSNEDQTQEDKAEFVDAPSDRESSIESFHTNKSELSIPTETELIDVDDIELSDEESWLYKSPKKLTSDEKALSTYKWLHKDVEEMDNVELYVTKNALVSKLNQLKMLNADVEKRLTKDKTTASHNQINDKTIAVIPAVEVTTKAKDNHLNQKQIVSSIKLEQEPNKNSENVLDVMDVHEIARLQEERLKQSTSRFQSQADISGKHLHQDSKMTSSISVQNVGLTKPSSVEALNICNGKINHSGAYGLHPMQGIKQQHMFGSSASLSRNQDLCCGSLPNINRGYYSLRRERKSKHPSDQKSPCPLPIYPSHPKVTANGSVKELPIESQAKMTSPPYAYRESRTLPSSYRVNSRSKSSSRRDLNLTPSPRRESAPFFPSYKSNPVSDTNRRDSAPCNPRRFLSPVSSPTLYQRCSASSPVLQSPTKAHNNSFQTKKTPPSAEYHRNASHSPSRRLPLNPVHNQSPKRGNSPASPRNGDFRSLKLPSKIPNPASRSGIPVPSMPYISRANADDDSWSDDCF
ncbi:SLAIN motif-containing protein-like isoform X2 [Stegodyphus dumicola]|uniref:SLAIN motif-containing protein-like isoform X2 n=1 Tax=Stegodyphus dumicola TaxID=202533 RepID=UPI0015B0E4D1|nr:SLAIN motif-containing protein-like isoform X2 [Stegodyphus dumicola]